MENEYATFKEDKPKIYDFNSMVIGTFIGGPLVIGYMLAENYRAFNLRGLAITTWIFTILISCILAWVIYNEGYNVFSSIFSNILFLSIPLITLIFVKILQGSKITDYLNKGGKSYSLVRAIFISLPLMVISAFTILSYCVNELFGKW